MKIFGIGFITFILLLLAGYILGATYPGMWSSFKSKFGS